MTKQEKVKVDRLRQLIGSKQSDEELLKEVKRSEMIRQRLTGRIAPIWKKEV